MALVSGQCVMGVMTLHHRFAELTNFCIVICGFRCGCLLCFYSFFCQFIVENTDINIVYRGDLLLSFRPDFFC